MRKEFDASRNIDVLRILIERAILSVALEASMRQDNREGSVFSPVHMAKLETERIINWMQKTDDKQRET